MEIARALVANSYLYDNKISIYNLHCFYGEGVHDHRPLPCEGPAEGEVVACLELQRSHRGR